MRCLKAAVSVMFGLVVFIGLAQPPPAPRGKTDENDPYAIIIKNNLFRPLGWKPNPPRPSYQLLGTVIVRGGPSMAIINLNGKTLYIKEGEKVGKAVLKKVEEKRALLIEGGKEIELRIDKDKIGFLSAGGGRSHGRGSSEKGRGKGEAKIEKPELKPPPPTFPRLRMAIPEGILRRIPPEIREKFKRASPGERREMIRAFREKLRRRRR